MASWPRVLASYEGESSNLWGYRGIWFRGKERMPMERTWKMQIYMLACVGMYVCIFMYSHAPKKNMEKEFSTVIFKRPRFIVFFDPPIFIHKLLFFYRILLSKLYPGIFHFFLIFFFFFAIIFPRIMFLNSVWSRDSHSCSEQTRCISPRNVECLVTCTWLDGTHLELRR